MTYTAPLLKCSGQEKENLHPVKPVELMYSSQEMWENELSDAIHKQPNPERGTIYRATDLLLTTQ